MAQHPPAARRAVARRLKAGEHPTQMVPEARAIQDPAHAAAALLYLAADDRFPAKKAAELVRDATKLLLTVDRPGRLAEAWGDALELATDLDRGPETATAAARMVSEATKTVVGMDGGEWQASAIAAVAPYTTTDQGARLLTSALANHGFEFEGAESLVRVHEGLIPQVKAEATAEVAARLLAKLADANAGPSEALEAAWAIADVAARREALRVLIWKMDSQTALDAVASDAKTRDPVDAAMVWIMIAGRMDRLGMETENAFQRAISGVLDLDDQDALRAHRKLAQAMEKSGRTPPPAPGQIPTATQEEAFGEIPIKSSDRHVFALVDGYAGGLGAPHVRAIARAAPLCVAFNLDLVLVGFPETTTQKLVDLVESETSVGEGSGYARKLMKEGRLNLLSVDRGVPNFWPGIPIATTPHPEEGKGCDLSGHGGKICLLIGLGKQGIPKRMLNVVDNHHELTGSGVSLETATAMGILADRLGKIRA